MTKPKAPDKAAVAYFRGKAQGLEDAAALAWEYAKNVPHPGPVYFRGMAEKLTAMREALEVPDA